MILSHLLLGAVTGALAFPAHNDYTLHERRDALPSHWNEGRRLDPKASLPMRIGLTQRNLDHGEALLAEISDPHHENYGKHLSLDEVHDLFAPHEESVGSVREWLESAGISSDRISQSANKQWLQFDADAEEAEKLLQAEYYVYSHSGSGRSHVACREYHVPSAIRHHIDYITPGIKLLEVRGAKPSKASNLDKRQGPNAFPPILRPLTIPLDLLLGQLLELCDMAVTPPCIRAMYNFTKGDKATPGNELGIFEDLGDIYSQQDLDNFFATMENDIPSGTHPQLRAIDGAKAPTSVLNAGPESDLDFQISYPIIWPQNSVLYQTDDMHYENNYVFKGFLNNFLDAIDGSYCDYSAFGETGNDPKLDPPYPDQAKNGYKGQLQCGKYKPTNVISISYGGNEADLPMYYQRRQCNEFMKLGLQGITTVVASGDSGVAGSSGCLGKNGNVFTPDFPATCPFLLTVGSTFLPPGANAGTDQETATTRFPSGGGFSNIYPRADYQKAAVAQYFKVADPHYKFYESKHNNSFGANGGIYNRVGRGYPDVGAIGDNVVMFNMGLPTLVGGTSASAPTWASLLTRVNEERLAAGKSTVGFVNPALYAHPEVFHDITQGSNPGCGTNGFSCAEGWDPVTGMGTPNYPELLKMFMAMP